VYKKHNHIHIIDDSSTIREKWPDIKVIAISGGFKGGHKENALEAARRIGADLALDKPFSEEELIAGVDNMFAERANPSQLAAT
jgi:CheY-like chemotaxis protein|tara:strand:+ start:2746 stop:2997 length:252 start_codon:yes stop_codon:yes gene_type:complete